MTEVSDKFVKLATANGRHVRCKIKVGSETYYDENIIKFDFDDVTHPDWFTIGTTCSNEFSFTLYHYKKFDVHTAVYPYISFDGEEWCPLGVFYIARRYFRGEYATFVCFDKMYDLDIEIGDVTTAECSKADKLLAAICGKTGITFKGKCVSYDTFMPETRKTARDLIGYIAALNCACAKFDRNGNLVFNTYSEMPTEQLSAQNCFDITLNLTRAGISGLRVNTGTETLRYGETAGLSVVDMYNPFTTQSIVNAVGKQLDGLYFYGAEIEMQGLPFLKSGEFIQLKNTDGSLTPIVMSEIRYHYDGALTVKLFSKNKFDSDPVVHLQKFENAISELWEYVHSLK